MYPIYAMFIIISLVYLFIIYTLEILIDVLLLSVVGYLLTKIVNVKFKYRSIFNMSIYALTLSILLYLIYTIVNIFTMFTVKYFDIAYNAIAYIYMITAILTIKSDLIKQQIELQMIQKEQKKVKEENREEKEKKEEKENSKKPEDKENKKEKKEKNNGEQAPEGNRA